MSKAREEKKAEKSFKEAQCFEKKDQISPEIFKLSEFLKNIAEERDKQEKYYRAKLEEKNRQEYLGLMATATTHQINQPIGSIRAMISGTRTLLKQGLFEPDELEPLLEDLWTQSERLKNIINTFQGFAAGDRVPQAAVNLNQVVNDTLALFAEQLKQRGIQVKTALDPTPPITQLNPFQLQEALINLLTNARDALETQENAEISLTTGHSIEKTVFLRIADNGPGIPATFAEHMFLPFTTTKSTEQGTGMGLHISRKIIAEANGTLEYQPNDSGGACFIITLPHYQQSTGEQNL